VTAGDQAASPVSSRFVEAAASGAFVQYAASNPACQFVAPLAGTTVVPKNWVQLLRLIV
jgi:hypothetical protein